MKFSALKRQRARWLRWNYPPVSTVVAEFNLQTLRSVNLITGRINNSFCRLKGGGNKNP